MGRLLSCLAARATRILSSALIASPLLQHVLSAEPEWDDIPKIQRKVLEYLLKLMKPKLYSNDEYSASEIKKLPASEIWTLLTGRDLNFYNHGFFVWMCHEWAWQEICNLRRKYKAFTLA